MTEQTTPVTSRRTIIKAAAWAAPVVAVAATAPFAAATTPATPVGPGNSIWSGGVNVYENNWDTPNTVEVNTDGSTVGWTRTGVAAGTQYIPGNSVTVEITWSAASAVRPTLVNGNGWTLTSGSYDDASSGALTFTFGGEILNGIANAVVLPSLSILPISGNVLPAGNVQTYLRGSYLQQKNAGTTFGAPA